MGLLVFVILFVPTLIFGIYYYGQIDQNLTQQVYSQRTTAAALSAGAISAKLTGLIMLADKYATEPSLISAMSEGNWVGARQAVSNLENNPGYYNYYIDRVYLDSPSGTVEAAYPGITSGVGVPDVAVQEWYQPIVGEGQGSFVSDVFKRYATSTTSFVEVLVPVKSADTVVGVFSFTVPINEFSDYVADVNIGSTGFIYIVDRKGHIVSHPKYPSYGPIVDYSSLPVVQAVMAGQSGQGTFYNSFEQQNRVVAYQPVPTYGWGVIAQEPVNDAFATRNAILHDIIFLILAFSFVELLFGLLLAWIVDRKPAAKKRTAKRS